MGITMRFVDLCEKFSSLMERVTIRCHRSGFATTQSDLGQATGGVCRHNWRVVIPSAGPI